MTGALDERIEEKEKKWSDARIANFYLRLELVAFSFLVS